MQPQVLITPGTIVVTVNGLTRTILKSEPIFAKVKGWVLEENWKAISEELTISKKTEVLKVEVKETDHLVTKDGKAVHPTIQERILPLSIHRIKAFQAACEKNPDPRSIDDLLDFLRHKALPVTPKGTFLAFKSVNDEYKDHYSKSFDNRVGQSPFMDRKDCDMNRKEACSTGFHVGAFNYSNGHHSPNRLMIIEVHPKHVTSVPLDSGLQKLRCHNYKVIAEYNGPRTLADAEAFILNLAGLGPKPKTAAKKEVFVPPAKPAPRPKVAVPKDERAEPTKKEVLAYALHLKATKKGDRYTRDMVESKYKNGLKLLKGIATDPKNPSRINGATREILTKILNA